MIANLLFAALVLLAPLLCLLAADYVERVTWHPTPHSGMHEAVRRGLVGWDDVN